MQYEIPIMNIYYVEAVDNRVFLYCSKQIYETKRRLYEIEDILVEKNFLRVSKSVVLNLMKVKAIKPAMNGRFLAILLNDEEIIISRKYVSALKNKLKGEK
ncbi:MAG: LytTR family transcriptional regulator DNA-binding domain-containing protein [Lachnospiraceae bacterium]|nr:LytTR family transcriptional regulator DNA-binding domain-containing protein [Lachnospiraceae bacterium]MBQ5851910.1 LytTR family transcriptional regulator DNA-binding domain-containing protein [Lachnospiraceae bacterium]